MKGRQKAAVLLVSLGADAAAEIFKRLRQDEIDELTLEIAALGHVAPSTKREVVEEFYETAVAQQYISEGGIDYARGVLERALGQAKANEVMSRLSSSIHVTPFDFLRRTDAAQIRNVIANEHPQTVALILAHLSAEAAAQVMRALPEDQQADVAMRIALMDRTAPEVIREIERVLERKLSSAIGQDFTSVGGVESLVELLNKVDRPTERTILEALDERDPSLADEVRRKMFLFEDIVVLDDRTIQQVLREVDGKELGIALKGTSNEVKEKIFTNMSERAAAIIREDLEVMGPVRVKQVEEAQQKVVAVIRRLEEAGAINIVRGSEDELVA
jgi:flagellar motor switch protein FliG